MNLTDLPQALWDELKKALTDWSVATVYGGADSIETIFRLLIGWIRDLSFITHTPLDLVNAGFNAIGLDAFVPLLNALTGTAFLFAAVEYAGHYAFGWPHIGHKLQMIGIAIVLVKISQQITDWSLQMMDALTSGIAVTMPAFPTLEGTPNFVSTALLGLWLVLFARLALAAARRIAWLAILKPLAPLAFMTFLHQKSRWLGAMWVELWIGWLVGQLFLILGIQVSVVFVAVGGFAGYVLALAALMVAHDAVEILAPKSGPPLVSVGPVKIG